MMTRMTGRPRPVLNLGFLKPRAQCMVCGKAFFPNLVDDPREDGGVDRHMDCPHCLARYDVARITRRGLELTQELQDTPINEQKKIRRLRRELKKEVLRP